MKTPKTPIEFDYDLWTTEDGKCMVRVKRTGEVSEVDRKIMRILRAEEKRIRRSYGTDNTSEDEDGAEKNSDTVLSLDAMPEDDVKSAAWLADSSDFIKEAELKMLEMELIQTLTPLPRKPTMSSMPTFPDGWMKRFSGRSSLPKQCPRTTSGSR